MTIRIGYVKCMSFCKLPPIDCVFAYNYNCKQNKLFNSILFAILYSNSAYHNSVRYCIPYIDCIHSAGNQTNGCIIEKTFNKWESYYAMNQACIILTQIPRLKIPNSKSGHNHKQNDFFKAGRTRDKM